MKVQRLLVSKPKQKRSSFGHDDLMYSSISPPESLTNISDFSDLFDYNTDNQDINSIHTNAIKDTLKVPGIKKYRIRVPSIKIPNVSDSCSVSNSVSVMSTLETSCTTACSNPSPSIISSCNSSPAVSVSVSGNNNYQTLSPMVTTQINGFNIIKGQYNKYFMSSNGFSSGYHEWTIKVTKCDLLRQEIGIVSTLDPNVEIGNFSGLRENTEFSARAIYGVIPEVNSFYYASYNNNNSCRCEKPLSIFSSWSNDDHIKICLDLNKGSITFFLNDKKVRKSISIQKNTTYYPIISCSGKCRYQIVDYNNNNNKT